MSDEERRRKLWQEDYGSEEEFLHAWGFSRDTESEQDLWWYGSRASRKAGRVELANFFTRQQAFNKIAEWMDRHE
jgi:hypothetical protein